MENNSLQKNEQIVSILLVSAWKNDYCNLRDIRFLPGKKLHSAIGALACVLLWFGSNGPQNREL